MHAMRWDSFLVRTLALELNRRLRGQRVRALLLDPAGRRVHLFLREATLVVELHPEAGWVLLLDPVDPDPAATPLPGRVRLVEAVPDERILRVSVERIRGRDEGVELVLSWIGTRWNAVVVGHQSRRIRDVLLPRHGGEETLIPGALWVAPRRDPRAGAPDGPPLDPAAMAAWPSDGPSTVLREVAWASPLNVEALLGPEGPAVWQALSNPTPEPRGCWILEDARGRPFVYPVRLPTSTRNAYEVPSLLDGMAVLRAQSVGEARDLLLPRALLEGADRFRRRLEKQRGAMVRELARTPDPAVLRGHGDLLLAFFHKVPRGVPEVQLEGFDGAPVILALDPALGVQENAARLYREAARASRARADLPHRIAEVEATTADLAALVHRVEAGESTPSELDRRLDDAGIRADRADARGTTGGMAPSPLPYHRFRSSGGLEIRVGRGARHNDALTFHHARPGEIWLHVREAPGAHVVLRWEGEGGPPGRDLEEAAILAAVHSDARHAGLVPVDWTRRKHVRKPRKAPPGAVIPGQVKTVFVTPDPELVRRLRW